MSIDLGYDLLNFIVSSELSPGDRLPPISQLQSVENLGIGASKVREQMEVARALGLVEVRSKTGTRLREYDFAPAVRLSLLFAIAQDPHQFESFGALRNHIESAFWHEACALLTEEDRQVMWDCVSEARELLSGQWIRIPHAQHRTFHLTVFKRLNNPFVLGLLEAYWDAYDAVQLNTYAEYAYLQSVWDYHERIITQISAGEFEAARQAFIEHTQLLQHRHNNEAAKEDSSVSASD
jgi:DNA-binding FadR family transcriptional regulator